LLFSSSDPRVNFSLSGAIRDFDESFVSRKGATRASRSGEPEQPHSTRNEVALGSSSVQLSHRLTTKTNMILPFDAHNHIHMGPSPPHVALFKTAALEEHGEHLPPLSLSGMAIMSTHPSDFPKVQQLSEDLPRQYDQNLAIVPCYGVHPWFLHELTDEHWKPTNAATEPCWLEEMRNQLVSNPDSIVGEIGLDGFHFDGTKPDRELSTPMDQQVEAFSLQMRLARELQRPVSIHTVQCFGPLAQCLGELKKKRQLPPKMYFHAYGGKEGTVDQLLALCGREIGQLYFGFAPIISTFPNSQLCTIVVLQSHHLADI